MYIQVPSGGPSGRRVRSPLDLQVPPCPCDGGPRLLGQAPAKRPVIKERDISIAGPGVTAAIARRMRAAVVTLSRSQEPILYNTALRIVSGDVPFKFFDEVRPKAAAAAALAAEGHAQAVIDRTLATHRIYRAEGRPLIAVAKTANPRAFEENGIVHVPIEADSSELEIDLPHEVNHVMNPITVDRATNPGGWMWEKFKGEVRASYVVNFRTETGLSTQYSIPYRLQRSIEHAHQQFKDRGLIAQPGWDPEFVVRMRSWVPDGNLVNSK